MNRTVRSAVLSAAVAATTLAAMPIAEAGERWRHHDRRSVVVHQHNDTGALVAAGILGLAVGAIAAGVASQPRRVYHDPYRYERADQYPAAPGYRDYSYDRYASGYEPWSPEWYRYCSQRYRSFDPRTGTFFIRPGVERFCVVE